MRLHCAYKDEKCTGARRVRPSEPPCAGERRSRETNFQFAQPRCRTVGSAGKPVALTAYAYNAFALCNHISTVDFYKEIIVK